MSGRDSASPPPHAPRPRASGAGRALAPLLLAALLVGCATDPPTAPAPRVQPPPAPVAPPTDAATTPPGVGAPAGPGTLVLHVATRSASDARERAGDRARGARAGRRHEAIRVREDALDRRGGMLRVPGAPRDLASDPRRQAAALLPASMLQLPALAATAVCENAPEWRRESRAGALTIVARGRGDEPWSTLETWADGKLVARSRTVWERRRGSWTLVSQEDAAGGESRTVSVDRSGLRRTVGDGVLPRVRCADPRSGIVAEGAPAGGAASRTPPALTSGTEGLAALGPVGAARRSLDARVAAEQCTPTEAEAEAACHMQLIAMVGASSALAGATAAAWAACITPAAMTIAPCVAAASAIVTAQAALLAAVDAYDRCKTQARAPKPCGCLASVVQADAGTPRPVTAPASAPVALDCSSPPPSGGGGGGNGGGGSGGGGGGHWVEICNYVDYYDEDGLYLYTEYLGCQIKWVQ